MNLPYDLNEVMGGLKDFQRRSVEYVFQRLYGDEQPTHRFLVADEAGLGKTMVAKGVIAQTVKHLWETTERIDIIYICSNSDIARQNINRLNITDQDDFVLTSRITMLPAQMKDLSRNKLNFVSFTPGTSFNLRSTLGMRSERVLLYWLLDQAWGIAEWGSGPKNALRGYAGAAGFRSRIKEFDRNSIDPTIRDSFLSRLEKEITADREAGNLDLKTAFEDLCGRYQWKRMDHRIPSRDKRDRARFIGRVRSILAQVCLQALEPDLVILDEFQRFKHLLSGDDEASILARDLFTYSYEHTDVRVLLLSATPYKMYTLSQEEEDNHYRDFIHTLEFLQNDPQKTDQFREMIDQYRCEFLRLGSHQSGLENLLAVQERIEKELKAYMVRTERLADSEDRNGMLVESTSQIYDLAVEDVVDYLGLEAVAENVKQRSPLEYWKSSPYLLNFMDGYKFKQEFEKKAQEEAPGNGLADVLLKHPDLLLSRNQIQSYQPIDLGNPRLRNLVQSTITEGYWQLLWVPPSLSYYQLGEPFKDKAELTKKLIFSAWRVVPKTVAVLLSYEVERQIFPFYRRGFEYSSYSDIRPLLQLQFQNERLTGMPVLGLMYPSRVLAENCDPLQIRKEGGFLALEDVLGIVEGKIQALLEGLPAKWVNPDWEVDEAWYWAAPILLDFSKYRKATRSWFEQENLAQIWSGLDEGEETHWLTHVQRAQDLLEKPLLGKPPADLAAVLAKLALGGPGVCALRALTRLSKTIPGNLTRNAAARIAWGFRAFYNRPESMAVIRGINSAEPYWQRLLEYAVGGGMQGVLDEYVHILRESLGLANAEVGEAASEIAAKMMEALTLRTVSFGVDDIQVVEEGIQIQNYRMRARFGIRFGDEKSEFSDEPTRADQVRSAFNSPFWPFVLTTTSVGQEGLDFHQYCHAIVHWNLPTNPVDLEQREGRVHRYKCHAVRKNVAKSYRDQIFSQRNGWVDPWQEMFNQARDQHTQTTSELLPYWIFPDEEGAKIERHVPALPLSRDDYKLAALRQSLAVYRMVFGQPRQEELIDYLTKHLPPEQIEGMVDQVKIDLSPPMKLFKLGDKDNQ